jgi:hypothetical protein
MIKTSSRQSGSAHVIIVIVLVAVLVGMLGFVFWKNYMNKDTLKSINNKNTQSEVEAEEAPYDGWHSYSLKREGLDFKYPSSWKLTDRSVTAGECMPNAQNCPGQSMDYVSLVSPSGLEMGISTGENNNVTRVKGQGCPAAQDVCTQYESNLVTINGSKVYMVITGYKQYNVAENLTLGLTQQKDCILSCNDGLGAARNLPGNIQVYATYPDRNVTSYKEFNDDQAVKEAKLIAESIHY